MVELRIKGLKNATHRKNLMWLLITLVWVFNVRLSCALTIDEAIHLARVYLPSLEAAQKQVQSSEQLYKASLSPYLPLLDAASAQRRLFSSIDDYNLSSYDLTLSYILFDAGRRKADRNIARLNLNIDAEQFRGTLIDVDFNVKSAFYVALARQEIVQQRLIQLKNAERVYEVAEGRHRLGAARLSDVLQASVRLEQARFNLVQGEGDLKNAISDLNSLLGRGLQTSYDLEGSLEVEDKLPNIEALAALALKRPEIKQAESVIQINENNRALETSTFFPVLSANASYNRVDRRSDLFGGSDEDQAIGIFATWNIFELGKFYRRKASTFSISVSESQLAEAKRQLVLDLQKTYQDVLTAAQNIKVSQQQLVEAEHNYSQAFGEYKVGRGDILSLVTAESLLASTREQLTTSELNHILSRALLERVAGVENLDILKPVGVGPEGKS
jgi:outer membrane protein